MVRILCSAVIIGAACFVTSAKLRSGTANPMAATQELTRCLTLVRAASARATSKASDRRYAIGISEK